MNYAPISRWLDGDVCRKATGRMPTTVCPLGFCRQLQCQRRLSPESREQGARQRPVATFRIRVAGANHPDLRSL